MVNSIKKWLSISLRTVRSSFQSRVELAVENLALRQQLAVFRDKRPKPRLTTTDRAFWVLLRKVSSGWRRHLILVRPETVVSWHRRGFRLYWRWKSRNSRLGRPRISKEIRDLIRQMAGENRWGAPRIHAELQKLGFDVDERTVSRYMPRRIAGPDEVERWKAFLRNHVDVIAAMDFHLLE